MENKTYLIIQEDSNNGDLFIFAEVKTKEIALITQCLNHQNVQSKYTYEEKIYFKSNFKNLKGYAQHLYYNNVSCNTEY